MIKDLRDYLKYLSGKGRLMTISGSVSPDLEITAYTDKASRDSKTLLFNNVQGFKTPVATNLFASRATLEELFDNTYVKEILANLSKIKSQKEGISLIKGAQMLMNSKPKVSTASLGKYKKLKNLDELPIMRSWPKDAGRFITLPLVITESPKDKSLNVGIYRMQVFDGLTTGMHWQTQKGGAIHAKEAAERKESLHVSVAIGTDPFNILAGATPLPPGMNEFAFSGVIRGSKTVLMRHGKYPPVPANSEIILYGTVNPNEKRLEGPFGDHTGYYSLADQYPVFHIDSIYAKTDAIYPASVVGHPWHEDAVIFQFMFDFLKPVLKSMNESIIDIYLPPEGIFTNVCFVKIKKRFPGEAKKAMFTILGMGQLSVMKMMVVFDEDVNIRDLGEVIWALSTRVDPQRDVQIIHGATGDSLDHTLNVTALGSKMLIDATKKTKEEGYAKEWPDTISLPDDLVKEVEKKWDGLKK